MVIDLFLLFLAVLVGFVVGAVVEWLDVYYVHRDYFDKKKEHEEWKQS